VVGLQVRCAVRSNKRGRSTAPLAFPISTGEDISTGIPAPLINVPLALGRTLKGLAVLQRFRQPLQVILAQRRLPRVQRLSDPAHAQGDNPRRPSRLQSVVPLRSFGKAASPSLGLNAPQSLGRPVSPERELMRQHLQLAPLVCEKRDQGPSQGLHLHLGFRLSL
jgi:hypothetical protein